MADDIRVVKASEAYGEMDLCATAAALVAAAPRLLRVEWGEFIDVYVVNVTGAGATGTLCITEYSSNEVALGNEVRVTEVAIPAAELTRTVNPTAFGLAAGAEVAVKQPIRVRITPYTYVTVSLSVSSGGTWHARTAVLCA